MEEIKSSILAIGGGKGGAGKSFFSSNLACALAMEGNDVILVDADLTDANLHTIFGIRYPERTLGDFVGKRTDDIRETLLSTPEDRLKLICGAGDILEIANPNYAQKEKLILAISSLEADYIIIDIGAGASLNNLDFFNMADMGFIVTSPTPTCVQNAYGFLKLAILRRVIKQFSDNQDLKSKVASMLEGENRVRSMDELLDALKAENGNAHQRVLSSINACNFRLVLNMATAEEAEKVARTMSSAVGQFLKVDLRYIGAIGFDHEVEKSIRAMKPLILKPDSPFTDSIREISRKVVASVKPKIHEPETPVEARPDKPMPLTGSASKVQLGLNSDVERGGMIIHVQTEDLGFDKEKILTLAFSDGRILLSKVTDYSELEQDSLQQKIIERVNWQHRAVLSGINTGKLDEKLGV